jgi:glycosyltransferase involved in cell wall biosynthesis
LPSLVESENKSKNKRVVACIPAFNEASNIGRIVKMVRSQGVEVIVCDDGSSDATYDEAVAAGASVVRHPFNKGYGAAIKTLFAAAKESDADVMVTIDSDGQHNPAQIPDVIKPIIEDNYDIVIGSRFLNEGDKKKVPAYRSFGIKTITKLAQLTSYNKLTDAQSGFRAYSKKALEKIDLVEDGMAVSTEILMRAGQRNLLIKEVPITIRYDVEDASTHNPLLHGIGVLATIVRFASLRHPFTFYGLPGFAFLIVAGYFMTSALDVFSATRFVSTNLIILSIGTAMIGLILLVTGVILNTLAALLREKIRLN